MAYTNSSLVDYKLISPHRTQNRNHAIDTITIHCTVGQVSVQTLGSIFQTKSASSNYGIGYDGKVGMYVEEKDRSWCSSSADNDHRAITIEVASDAKEPYAVNAKAYDKLIQLVADICYRNGIKRLLWKGDKSLVGQVDKQNMTWHCWFNSGKSCPGTYLKGKHPDIVTKVNAILAVREAADKKDETPAPSPAPSTTTFKAGDLVKITGSTYYNGQSIPNWVRNTNWYVYSVSKDRVVINKSQDGSKAIMSPVAASSLSLVQRPSEEAKPSPAPADEPKKDDIIYTVKSGDTLGAIAAKYKVTVALLAAYNGISNINLINVGQKIKIPADPEAAKKATTVEAGDLVKIIGTKYYGGKLIPNWVKAINWYVYSAPANSDRVVINKSQDGTKAIMSPVNRKDLYIVKKA